MREDIHHHAEEQQDRPMLQEGDRRVAEREAEESMRRLKFILRLPLMVWCAVVGVVLFVQGKEPDFATEKGRHEASVAERDALILIVLAFCAVAAVCMEVFR